MPMHHANNYALKSNTNTSTCHSVTCLFTLHFILQEYLTTKRLLDYYKKRDWLLATESFCDIQEHNISCFNRFRVLELILSLTSI